MTDPSRYSVLDTQTCPESYVEDYQTVNNQSYWSISGQLFPQTAPLDESEQVAMYAQLASGAESGWDYRTQWLARPNDAAKDMPG